MDKPKILIVDDDPDLQWALKTRLRANHYDTVQASDGYSAIAVAQKERPKLIILDLGLPAGDGFSVLERLRTNINMSSIPVIVVSARDLKSNMDRALKAGAKAFLQKPVDNAQLLSAIRKALGEKDHEPAVVHDLGEV